MNPSDIETPPVIRPLSHALQEVATRELNEGLDTIAQDILIIRKWILSHPYLKARTNDQFILAFLRGCKYCLQRVKQKIEHFYTLRAAIPEVFNDKRLVDDLHVLEIIRMGIILQIPLAANESGPCVTIIRATCYDIYKYKFQDIIRVGSMFGEIMMIEDDNSTVCGYLEIMDMIGVTMPHLFHLQPDVVRKFSTYAEEALPMRQKGTCFINVPFVFERWFNTFHGFVPHKMKSRITISSSPDAIYQHVSRKYLPAEYGGTNGTIRDIVDRMEAKLLKYRDYFLDEPNYGANEELRSAENSCSWDNCIVPESTLKKLEID